MKIYKKLKPFISLVCAVLLIFSTISFSVAAVSTNSVTAATGATVKQGYSYTCYVDIGSTEDIAALDVTVHFDPAKVKITNVYNSINCTLYDSVINTDNIQFSYILDGKGSASKTRLFYFDYQVLNNADLGNSYFDITIGEAYDNSLNDVSVSGSRCNFTITETVTNKSCSVYSSSPVSASVEKEFTLNYRFSTYQIASGTAVITYDPELFEVVKVTNGAFLTNKIVDVNTDLSGEIYISFVGTEYYSDANLVAVTFKPIKNVTEVSKIYFKAVELIDKELNSISCSGYTTNVNVAFDNTYTGDAPAMKIDGSFSYEDKQITLVVSLEKDSRLGAGDFVIAFDPKLVSYNSCTKGFTPSFFNINDKKVENGELKFHIISLSDITTEETVLTVVFDVKHPYGCATADFTLNGTGLTDSLTESIMLNFIDDSVWLEYQVKFLDADGTLLQSDIYHYGDIVAEPVAPTKESDVYGKYTFSGWDKEVAPCTADTVYTATYTLEYTDYTVIFKNWDDTEISRATYHYGDVVAVPETPAKEKDSYYIYNFDGWDKEVLNCSGNAEYKAVFSAGHYHTYEKTVTAPDCINQGFTTNTCACGDTYKDNYVAELGHDYKWVIDKAENCGITGLKHEKCSRCDAVKNENTVIPATGKHSYTSKVTTEPSCTVDGVETFTCTVCDDTYTKAISANGHTPADAVIENRVEPKCEIEGSYDEVVYCSVCTAEISRVKKSIDATGHSYTSQVISPNCTDKGYTLNTCTSCGDSYKSDYIDELGHDYKWVIDKAENCGVTGLKHEKCSRCDSVRNENTVIPATGKHSYTSKVTTEPSCTVEGVETFTCTVCGNTYTKAISANGHTPADAVIENRVEPKCEIEGSYDEVVYCSVCTAEISRVKKSIDATGHFYTSQVISPNCTDKGYTLNTCSSCGDTYKSDYIDELGHDYKWVIDKAENCGVTGLKHEKCNRCDSVRNENTVIPATEKHSYTSKVTTEPSCTVEGVETFTCKVCGDTYTKTISAKGHTPAVAVIENRVEPKCEVKGSYVEVVYCSECKTELSRIKKEIPETKHLNREYLYMWEPSCEEKGFYNGYVCLDCDKTIDEAGYIDSYGHEYEGDICKTCGESKVDNCTCACHSTGIIGIVWRIFEVIFKIFKANSICSCGQSHY